MQLINFGSGYCTTTIDMMKSVVVSPDMVSYDLTPLCACNEANVDQIISEPEIDAVVVPGHRQKARSVQCELKQHSNGSWLECSKYGEHTNDANFEDASERHASVSPNVDEMSSILEADFDAYVLASAKEKYVKLSVMKIIESVQLQQTCVQMYLNALQKVNSPALILLHASVTAEFANIKCNDLMALEGIAMNIANQCVASNIQQFSERVLQIKQSGASSHSKGSAPNNVSACNKKRKVSVTSTNPNRSINSSSNRNANSSTSAVLQSFHQSVAIAIPAAAVLPNDFLEDEFLLLDGILDE